MVLAGSITAQQRKEIPMPLVQVKLIEGVFTEDQKRQMIQKLTDAMVSIEGENMRQVTTVIVEEVKSGDWGIGGQPMTTSDVKALAAGKKLV
jgi:4-oxalocrotonate tautomerase